MNNVEFEIMKNVHEKTKPGQFAEPYLSGHVIVNDPILKSKSSMDESFMTENEKKANRIWSFIIQRKYGQTLDHFIRLRNNSFTPKTVA